jgi:hypothetical protein
VGTKDPEKVRKALLSSNVMFEQIGSAASAVEFAKGKKKLIKLTLKQLQTSYYSLEKVMH